MPILIKKIKIKEEILEKPQLLSTIRVGESFNGLTDNLPKPNYMPVKIKKEKGMKTIIDSIQEKTCKLYDNCSM